MKKQTGFTIIESLVIISIIIILVVVIAPFYQESKAQLALDRSASKLAQDIRFVLEKSLAAEPSCSSQYQYGIHLKVVDENNYKLFADCNNSNTYGGGDDILETVFLEAGIKFHAGTVPNNVNIVFEPPEPTIVITGGGSATIVLYSVEYLGKTRTITINQVGLIDID